MGSGASSAVSEYTIVDKKPEKKEQTINSNSLPSKDDGEVLKCTIPISIPIINNNNYNNEDYDCDEDYHRYNNDLSRLQPSSTSDDGLESPTNSAIASAELFSATAMSLEIENDELLFNMLYFGEDNNSKSFGGNIQTALDETVALHSENNTPYKLRPASNDTISSLITNVMNGDQMRLYDRECSICKDNIEIDNSFIKSPSCNHIFHSDCIIHWIKLQSFCPVCRAVISINEEIEHGGDEEEESKESIILCNNE
jgi:hypothetical protein